MLPVSEKHDEYARKVYEALRAAKIRTEYDDRNEKIGYKIREAQVVDRVPYMLVIGQQESDNGTVAVRFRDTAETKVMSLDEFVEFVSEEIRARK